MALKITIGQYWHADTALHRLDPRAKVLCSLILMVSVFLVRTPMQLAFSWATMITLVACAHVPPRKVISSVLPLTLMLVVLSVFNLLLVRTGNTLVSFGPIIITDDGLWAAVVFSLRLVVAVIAASLLMLTTTPAQLTDAFDAALAPLARLGLPAHEIAMVFSLMLRFIPTLAEEASAIVDAQSARGGALRDGSPGARIRALVPVVVALIASSMRHADGLARALDARCYEGGASRSHWHPMHMRSRDWVSLALTVAYVVVLLLLR